ncbi:DDE transposase [Bacteroidia bacterium]|nr:DDE transposase [Bacteroidia bacterium]
MNIFDFTKNFPDEESCILHFKAQREQKGVVCPKCGGTEHYWLRNKLSYECKHCHTRRSLRSGTVLEHTRLPFLYWYVAMHFLTITKKSFSSSELQRQLGHRRYQPVWELTNKLRDVMGKRDDLYSLSGQIELDNAFITTLIPENQKDEPLKRGAGSQKQSKVVVMTESEFVDNPRKGKKPKRVNHIKMQVINDMKADTVADIVKEQMDSQAELTTDDSTSYKKLGEHVQSHDAQVVKPDDLPKILPWVHIAIGNVKRLLLDTHHQLKKEYLQYYLNEFCYKFNRRYFGEKLFDRLVTVAVCYPTDFKSKIYNRTLCG